MTGGRNAVSVPVCTEPKLNVETNVENYRFRFLSVGHSAAGSGYVLINLERKEGTQFGAVLSADDAKRLLDDLPEQIRIAAQKRKAT